MRNTMGRFAAAVFLMLMPVLMPGGLAGAQTYPAPDPLLATGADTVGAPIRYPAGTPRVSSYILTMVPGQETGWHRHDVPLYARILQGRLTVDYGDGVVKSYRTGDTFMESMDRYHNGRVDGDGDAKLLIVFMGADGVPNTEMRK